MACRTENTIYSNDAVSTKNTDEESKIKMILKQDKKITDS